MNYLQPQKSRINIFQIAVFLVTGFMLMSFSYISPTKMAAKSEFGLFGDKNKSKKNKKDPYACKAKTPNIYSSNPPRTKSRSNLYMHAMAKKRVKKTNQSVFSATKSRYNVVDTKSQKQKAKANRGRKAEK